ncbi:hypothetical protein L228DRAFT_139819 [Xylona heveae TC161]|uniref:Secreted protein n=1 Tax=Xylona heveae (strain CBS 132557 / TC161) TaxID=1328760 RepID=A0A165H3J1_XYLHT|nr:hypothetical protein L228DRAFT_139819 [Xylona heveae TC161]KZF22934.1 hypothetical protein L228DRAFT_139819 [Xylona heveae TC161]
MLCLSFSCFLLSLCISSLPERYCFRNVEIEYAKVEQMRLSKKKDKRDKESEHLDPSMYQSRAIDANQHRRTHDGVPSRRVIRKE